MLVSHRVSSRLYPYSSLRHLGQQKQNDRTQLGKDQFESNPLGKTEAVLAKHSIRKTRY